MEFYIRITTKKEIFDFKFLGVVITGYLLKPSI
jgi:hypothetical protein